MKKTFITLKEKTDESNFRSRRSGTFYKSYNLADTLSCYSIYENNEDKNIYFSYLLTNFYDHHELKTKIKDEKKIKECGEKLIKKFSTFLSNKTPIFDVDKEWKKIVKE